jgi:hypothetical protein
MFEQLKYVLFVILLNCYLQLLFKYDKKPYNVYYCALAKQGLFWIWSSIQRSNYNLGSSWREENGREPTTNPTHEQRIEPKGTIWAHSGERRAQYRATHATKKNV